MAEQFSFPTADERGVCSICGAPAYHRMATKCDEHKPAKKAARAAQPQTNVKVDDVDGPRIVIDRPADTGAKSGAAVKADTDKAARAVALERSILQDVNPALIQGFAMLCKPIDPSVFYTIEGQAMVLTQVGATVVFSDGEAKILGKAAAELERSPVGQMAAGAVGPIMPIVFGLTAVGVVVFHGYRVMGLRAALLEQVRAQEQAQAMNDAGTFVPPTEPTVGDDVAAGFREADVRGFGRTNGNGPPPTITPEDVIAS